MEYRLGACGHVRICAWDHEYLLGWSAWEDLHVVMCACDHEYLLG